MTKEEIRIIIKERKALITLQEKIEAAQRIFATLEESAVFKASENILLYHSLPDEVSTLLFIEKWHTIKNIFLPRVNGNNLDILPYCSNSLTPGAFNIKEPSGDNLVDIKCIDLIIVPAVAIDQNGNRVGRGKGYYDRLLHNTKATKIGVIYDFQLVDNIDCNTHDINMDHIITPHNSIIVNTQKHKLWL